MRLTDSDCRYQKNEFIFYRVSRVLSDMLKRSIAMSAKIGSISDLVGNRSVLKRDIFLTSMKIRSTQAYNRKMYTDLMAMVFGLGPPSWFLTLRK